MCYVELEPCEVWTETETLRRARKTHRCSSCKGPIRAGEEYLVHFSIMDGEICSEKSCAACTAARSEFGDAHGGIQPTPSYLPVLLADCVAEGDAASDTRWRPMLNAVRARAEAPHRERDETATP